MQGLKILLQIGVQFFSARVSTRQSYHATVWDSIFVLLLSTFDMVAPRRTKRPITPEIESPTTQIARCREAAKTTRTREVETAPLALRAAQNNTLAATELVKKDAETKAAAAAEAAAAAAAAAAAEAAAEAKLALPFPNLDTSNTSKLQHQNVVKMLKESPNAVFAANATGIGKIDISINDIKMVAEHVINGELMRPIAVGTFNMVASPELDYHLPGQLFEYQKTPLVVRVTRVDAMEDEPGDPPDLEPYWRASKYTNAVSEIAWSLVAAKVGFGPKVYATAIYPFPNKPSLYATILVLKQYKGNLNESLHRMAARFPQLEKGRLCYRGRTELFSLLQSLSSNWAELARRCIISFDTKLGNVVANDQVTKLIDYDPDHFYRTTTTPRVCWLCNCLLTLTHVRSWGPSLIADEFVAMCADHMSRIVDEIEQTAGSSDTNETWILEVATPRPRMSFQHSRICSFKAGEKLTLHLQSMVSTYFTAKGSTASSWPGWKRGYETHEPLIKTLLAYLGN